MITTFTHGISATTPEPIGCSHRFAQIRISENGNYHVEFVTQYEEKAIPVVTEFRLSQQAAEMLTHLLNELALNKNDWKFVKDN